MSSRPPRRPGPGPAGSFRGREGRFDIRVRKESPANRITRKSPILRGPENFRGHEELTGFSLETARDRIRRENEQHNKRSSERSRSRNRRDTPEREPTRSRRSRSGDRKGHSNERRGRSTEQRSGGMRFEPPDHRMQDMEFNRRHRSSSKDRRARYQSPDVQFVEEGLHRSNRFSPPAREEFRDGRFNKFEFESRPNFDNNLQLNAPTGGASSVILNNQVFPENQNFLSQSFDGLQENPMGVIAPYQPGAAQGGFPENAQDVKPSGFEIPLIPEFNPELTKLSSHDWVKLIEDTAKQYDWKKDEKQYIMASRLSGFARQWYLSSGVRCKAWGELRQAFLNAFPTEMGYHTLLTKMISRHKDDNETMASYFHHKVALLNACDILGRKAISCIIAGLPVGKIRIQAKSHNFEDPDELYLFLRSCDGETSVKKPAPKPLVPDEQISRTKGVSIDNKVCFNCKQRGHLRRHCPRPSDQRLEDPNKEFSNDNKVMHGSLARKPTYPKYFTDVNINGVMLNAYVDQGSECSTIREENSNMLKLPIKKQYKVVRGFAGSSISSIGVVDTPLYIDRAIANIKLYVVPDHIQAIPVIVGQGFTEQPHVVIMKDGDRIRFYQRMDNGETNFDF